MSYTRFTTKLQATPLFPLYRAARTFTTTVALFACGPELRCVRRQSRERCEAQEEADRLRAWGHTDTIARRGQSCREEGKGCTSPG